MSLLHAPHLTSNGHHFRTSGVAAHSGQYSPRSTRNRTTKLLQQFGHTQACSNFALFRNSRIATKEREAATPPKKRPARTSQAIFKAPKAATKSRHEANSQPSGNGWDCLSIRSIAANWSRKSFASGGAAFKSETVFRILGLDFDYATACGSNKLGWGSG